MDKTMAVVFPGQGAQSLGMLSNFAHEKLVLETFEEASDILGYDLFALAQTGPEEKLNKTEFTQPVVLTASVACWRFYHSQRSFLPKFLAGHSLGEYTALVCAKALSFKDGLSLVALRGRLMQKAISEDQGAMAAIIGLSDELVKNLCDEISLEETFVSAANYNAPLQVVIAGNVKGVNKAIERAKDLGAKRAIRLSISVPSHCFLMKPASLELAEALKAISINPPIFPILHNVDAEEHPKASNIRDVLERQLYQPVRWVDTVKKMVEKGVECIVECGPGNILTGLNKRIAPNLQCLSVSNGEV